MYLERQAAVPHIAAGYFGRQPRISEPELRLPKQDTPHPQRLGQGRECSGVWEERREGDRSLRKQLSLSWEPQGPLNVLCFPPQGGEGWGSSLPAVLRKVYFELRLWEAGEAGYRKESHPACLAPPFTGYSAPT